MPDRVGKEVAVMIQTAADITFSTDSGSSGDTHEVRRLFAQPKMFLRNARAFASFSTATDKPQAASISLAIRVAGWPPGGFLRCVHHVPSSRIDPSRGSDADGNRSHSEPVGTALGLFWAAFFRCASRTSRPPAGVGIVSWVSSFPAAETEPKLVNVPPRFMPMYVSGSTLSASLVPSRLRGDSRSLSAG